MSKVSIKILTLILILGIVLTGTSCSLFQSPNIGISTSDTIGMTGYVVDEIEKMAVRDGYPIAVLSADGLYDVQEMHIASLIEQEDLNVLAICPVDFNYIETSIAAANEAEIPVVLFEKPSNELDVAFFGGYDAAEEGKLAAQAIVEQDDGKENIVVEILGPEDNPNAVNASKGFHDVIDTIDNITVVQINSSWNVQSAYDGMKSILRKYPTISAIYSSNSSLEPSIDAALDEIGLLKQVGAQDHIYRVSVSGSKNGYDSVVNGYVDLLIVTDLDSEAKAIYDALVVLGSGKKLETTSFIASSTSYLQEIVERKADEIWGVISGIE